MFHFDNYPKISSYKMTIMFTAIKGTVKEKNSQLFHFH